MHRYFLIPVLGFFGLICLIVIYLQYINEDWKYLVPKQDLPSICKDEKDVDVKLITHDTDLIKERSFKDSPDQINKEQIHAIFLLPCEMKDRKFDVNHNIESSLITINKWFFDKSNSFF
mgnify:FL=1